MSQEEKKKIAATVKLRLIPGNVKMPEVAAALGQKGIPRTFVDRFNGETEKLKSSPTGKHHVKVIAYTDKSFDIECHSQPSMSQMIRDALKVTKLSTKGGARLTIDRKIVEEVASLKMKDLNARTKKAAIKIVEGSLRSMAINIKD